MAQRLGRGRHVVRHARRPAAAVLIALAAAAAMERGAAEARQSSCAPVYGTGATAAELAAFSCESLTETTITSSHGPVHVSLWARTPSTAASTASISRRILEDVRSSIAAYDPFAPVSWDITVAIGYGLGPWRGSDADRNASGIAKELFRSGRASIERCVIDLNLQNTHEGFDYADYRRFLDWVVAHEVFHCVQGFNFTDAFHTTGDEHTAHKWWIEGQAEYFPSLVVPQALELGGWDQFSPLSRSQNVFDIGAPDNLGYPNAVLFAYLDGPRLGSAGLYRLFRGLPAHGGADAQAQYLSGQSFGAMLDDFAMALADGSIAVRVPGRSTVEIDPTFDPPPFPVNGAVDVFFSADTAQLALEPAPGANGSYDALHVYRGQMALAPRKVYRVATSGGGKIDVKPAGYDWIRAPTGDDATIDACEAPQLVTAVATEVDPHAAFVPKLSVTVVDGEQPVCGERDQCLVGRWQPDQRHIDKITHSLGAGANARTTEGPIEIAFFADGRWSLVFQNLAFAWLSSPGVNGRVAFAGEAQGRWTAAARTGFMSDVLSDHTRANAYMRGQRITTLPKIASSFGMAGSSGPLPYQCSADTLTFTDANPGGLVYHRVSRDPVRRR